MHTISNILLFLLGGSLMVLIVVGIHEGGHFCAAWLTGVKIQRLVIGFGKPLLCYKSKAEIEYILGAIPLGGYVKLLDSREQTVPQELLKYSYDHQAIWKRAIIILAGPFFNFIFAIGSLCLVWMIGFTSLKPIVKQVTPSSIAQQAGIKSDDQIIAVEDHLTNDWQDVIFAIIANLGDKQTLNIKVKQTNGINHLRIIDLSHWQFDPTKPQLLKSVGIEPLLPPTENKTVFYYQQASGFKGLMVGVTKTWYYIVINFTVLYKIVSGKLSLAALAGPLTIFISAANSLKEGLVSYLHFLGIISIAIGVVNILPIPGLDGSQLIYFMIEKIRGKALSIRVQVLIFKLGMVLIYLLFIQVMLNDIQRLLP